MLAAGGVLEQARKARDPRFDGRFFIAVRTTGIYCRPVCRVKMPRAENVTFFASAAAASEAGYRPCMRCRPEAAPGTPAWAGTSTTVTRALRLINDGGLDEDSVAGLADRLGVTSRHLNRLFTRHLGASVKAVGQTRKLQFAKKLIDSTQLPMTEIAMAAGYGSVRRFNDHIKQVYDRTPRDLRKDHVEVSGHTVTLFIGYRQPFDFASLLSFLAIRAIPGVEQVGDEYRRNFQIGGDCGSVTVKDDSLNNRLVCEVEGAGPSSLMQVHDRVARLFDVDAMPDEVNAVLVTDKMLAPLVRQNPGQRVPGAFDQFEISVRAIVGQQVSVKGATTVMGRIAELYGPGGNFPGPEELSQLDPDALPMPRKRAMAIKEMARRVSAGEIRFDVADDEAFEASMLAVPGIGPWTAQYIAMRALGDPDAFLHGDLVIKKVAKQVFDIDNEADLIERSEAWRPWRGYAGMHLWRTAAAMPQRRGAGVKQ